MMQFLITYLLTPQAHAQALSVGTLMARINRFVINPLITLLFIVAFVIFVWGLFSFFQAKGGNGGESGIEKGKRHVMWGIIGMTIMVSVFGIMQLLINSLGVQGVDPNSPEIGNLSGN